MASKPPPKKPVSKEFVSSDSSSSSSSSEDEEDPVPNTPQKRKEPTKRRITPAPPSTPPSSDDEGPTGPPPKKATRPAPPAAPPKKASHADRRPSVTHHKQAAPGESSRATPSPTQPTTPPRDRAREGAIPKRPSVPNHPCVTKQSPTGKSPSRDRLPSRPSPVELPKRSPPSRSPSRGRLPSSNPLGGPSGEWAGPVNNGRLPNNNPLEASSWEQPGPSHSSQPTLPDDLGARVRSLVLQVLAEEREKVRETAAAQVAAERPRLGTHRSDSAMMPPPRRPAPKSPTEALKRNPLKMGLGTVIPMAADNSLNPQAAFRAKADELRDRITNSCAEQLDLTFAHCYTPTDALLGLYMHSYSQIFQAVCGHILEECAHPADVATVAACWYTLNRQARDNQVDVSIFPPPIARLLAYWGTNHPYVINSMVHTGLQPMVYSKSQAESGLGGHMQGGRSVAHFETCGALSCVVYCVTQEGYVVDPEAYIVPRGSKVAPNTKYHIAVLPVLDVTPGLSPSQVRDIVSAAERVLLSVGVTVGQSMYRAASYDGLKKGRLRIYHHKTVPLGMAIMPEGEQTIPVGRNSDDSFFMPSKSPSSLKCPDMVRAWSKAGGKCDIRRATDTSFKPNVFKNSVKQLMGLGEQSNKWLLNWQVEYTQGGRSHKEKVCDNGTICNSQFAGWMFARSGGFGIEDLRGRISGLALYDPPIWASGAPLCTLVSAGWEAKDAIAILNQHRGGAGVPLKKLSVGQIQSFMALQAYNRLPPDTVLVDHVSMTPDIRAEYDAYCQGAALKGSSATGKHLCLTELETYTKVCGVGISRGLDRQFFNYLRAAINPLACMGVGLGERPVPMVPPLPPLQAPPIQPLPAGPSRAVTAEQLQPDLDMSQLLEQAAAAAQIGPNDTGHTSADADAVTSLMDLLSADNSAFMPQPIPPTEPSSEATTAAMLLQSLAGCEFAEEPEHHYF